MDMIKLHHDFTLVPGAGEHWALTRAHAGAEGLWPFLRLRLEAINVPNEFSAYHYGSRRAFGHSRICSFCLNQSQLPGVQPIPSTVWTMIDLDSAFGAEIVAEELYTGAPWAFPFSGGIHLDCFVPPDFKQRS